MEQGQDAPFVIGIVERIMVQGMRWWFCSCMLIAACSVENEGLDPPSGELNFPIALGLSRGGPDSGPTHLYVANSNFDLRFNAGTVQSFRLETLDAALRDDCTVSRPCSLPSVGDFLESEVLIGSFASGLSVSPDGTRVYLPVRSDANLTFVDVDEQGRFSCGGQAGRPHRCSDAFRRGDERSSNLRGERVPNDPVGLHVGSLADDFGEGQGDYVLMAHRVGAVSFFLDRAEGAGQAPALIDVLGDLPRGLADVAVEPGTTRSWIPNEDSALLTRVGIAFDDQDPERSFLFDAGGVRVLGVDFGEPASPDFRIVRFDPGHAGRAYILTRRPEAVLIADASRNAVGNLDIERIVEIGAGPSRLRIAELGGRTLLFASCFDSRDVFFIDGDLGQVVGVMRGMSGPFELAVDVPRQRLYVADFRASVLRIATLKPLVDCLEGSAEPGASCSPEIIATLGEPRPVEELQ